MKAIRFLRSIPRYLIGQAAGAFSKSFCVGGISNVQLRHQDPPKLPGSDWVSVRPVIAGICGSDLRLIFGKMSPSLEPFSSGPFTLGHENVGIVEEAGPAAGHLKPGNRIVVDTTLGCVPRGISPPCEWCRKGYDGLCLNQTRGQLGAGHLGFNKDTGGSWSERFVAHHLMVHCVPDAVSNEDAALLEPFASALHPVLEYPPVEGDRVLVLGAGIIGLCTIAALRAVGPKCQIWVAARYLHQVEMARRLGADLVFGRDDDLYAKVAGLTGSPLFKPTLGKRILLDGVDLVYDCVGSAASIDDALRLLRPKGRLVLIGTASVLKVDWSFVWFKELSVHGALMYQSHLWNGIRQSTYEIALSLLERGAVRLAPLLTKTYPIEAYREAILAAANKASSGAIKIAFRI